MQRGDGILLVNLGTPAAPTAPAVRTYLAEFLSDPRVVELPRPLWLPLLYGVILNVRPAKSAAKYAAIWTPEGSPLAVHTRRQSVALTARLSDRGLVVEHAMRYGEPSIAAGFRALAARGCQRIRVVPLYPQYSGSTTGSVVDAVSAAARRLSLSVDISEPFFDHPGYVRALAAGIRTHWAAYGQPEMLVLSFHGIPQRSVNRGDPYERQCRETARLLAIELGEPSVRVTFQSRFGPAQWLQPYTEPTLVGLAEQGIRHVGVACPGFVSDCLETLEEIAIGAREEFLRAGGTSFQFIPCLNESAEWIDALAEIALSHPAQLA